MNAFNVVQQRLRLLALVFGITTLTGCTNYGAQIAAGVGSFPAQTRPTYDVPAQIVYRIDDKRYFSIENYEDCSVGGDVYYHDERNNLKTKVAPYGMGIWPGRYSIEPSELFIAVPGYGCNRDGYCSLSIRLSTDGGKTFDDRPSIRRQLSHSVDRDGLARIFETTRVVLKADDLYVWRLYSFDWKTQLISQFRFKPGMNSDQLIATGVYSDEGAKIQVPEVKTPSGQDRFSCDTRIKPKNTESRR